MVVALVAWGHTLLRDDRWAYEWTWALFQYQMVVLLIAPVVAAAAALEAVSLRGCASAVRSAGRSSAFGLAVVARTLACVAAGLTVGVVPVLLLVWRARGFSLPTFEAIATIGPAAAQLLAVIATSYAVAWRWPRPVVVPVIATAWFVLLVGANVVLPERLVRIGGASASLSGLHVSLPVQGLQIVVALAVGAIATGWLWSRSVPGTPLGPRCAAIAAPALVVALVTAGVSRTAGPLFDQQPVARSCVGTAPSWCVTEPYLAAIDTLRERAGPTLKEIDAVGAARPERITQRRSTASVNDLLYGDPLLWPVAVVYAWLPFACSVRLDSSLLGDLSSWTQYLDLRLAGGRSIAAGAEAVSLRAAADRIRECDNR